MIFGYLDPITGSALLQVALGGLAALGLGWQYVRKGFRSLASRLKGGDSTAPRAEQLVDHEGQRL